MEEVQRKRKILSKLHLSGLIFFFFIIIPNSSYAEFVFTKDGAITEGTIVSETAADVTVKSVKGKIENIPRFKIMRILYTQLYMGRMYVQMTDGSGLELFMVDEDQEYYIFRAELNKPAEMKVRRTDVLFIARKNPSGLKTVKVETDRIEIKWLPPYNQVKFYKVYYRSNPNEKYIHAGDSFLKSFTIKNLKSNTQYFINVTAIDREDYESLPSNIVRETTKNIPPDSPKNLKAERIPAKDKKPESMKIKWDPATDPDGSVVTYNIYRKQFKKDILIGTTARTDFEISDIGTKKDDEFYIRSVDNKKSESSSSSSIYASEPLKFKLGVQIISIIPLLTFGNLHTVGFGVLINTEWQNVFFNNFNIGISVGYWELQGKSNAISSIDYSMMVPFLATVSYRISPINHLSIIPRIALGYSINYVAYRIEFELYTGYSIARINKTKIAFQPIILPGLAIQWDLSKEAYINAGSDFGMIIERSGLIAFVSVSIEAGIRF